MSNILDKKNTKCRVEMKIHNSNLMNGSGGCDSHVIAQEYSISRDKEREPIFSK